MKKTENSLVKIKENTKEKILSKENKNKKLRKQKR